MYHRWKGLSPPLKAAAKGWQATFRLRRVCRQNCWDVLYHVKVYRGGNCFYGTLSKANFGHEECHILHVMTILELVNFHHRQLTTTCVFIPQIYNMLWSRQCRTIHLYQEFSEVEWKWTLNFYQIWGIPVLSFDTFFFRSSKCTESSNIQHLTKSAMLLWTENSFNKQ